MMKSLNEYDTPEFDLLLLNNKYQEPCDFREDITELCKSLEQRLAACREALDIIYNWPDGGHRYGQDNMKIFALKTLTLTLTAPK